MTHNVYFIDKGGMLDAIKKHYNIKRNTDFASFLGITSQAVSNWYSRNTFDAELLYTKCVGISAEWLLTGEGDMLVKKEENIQLIHNPIYPDKQIEDQDVFLYDIYAAANLKTLFLNKDQNILGKISIPNIPACDGAVYINGDSMYPLLKSGDIIAYKEIRSLENILYGEMYLISFDIDGDEFLTVKYINRSELEGCIKLVSYNSHHDPKDIPLKSINALGLVKLSIRKNTMI